MREGELVTRHLGDLFRVQHRALCHSMVLARRLELGHGAFRLYEVVRHTDAALEDLRDLGEGRGVALESPVFTVHGFLARARSFFMDLVSETHACCRATLLEHLQVLEHTLSLRDAARHGGDDVLWEWCTECLHHRLPMLENLAHAFAHDQPELASTFLDLDVRRFTSEQQAQAARS
jgi:hypothetical protein